MGIKIYVSEDDITNGDRGQAESCMIARAIRTQLNVPEEWSVTVDESLIGISNDETGASVVATTPVRAAKRISDYDADKDVEPFTLVLDLPKDWREQVAAAAE